MIVLALVSIAVLLATAVIAVPTARKPASGAVVYGVSLVASLALLFRPVFLKGYPRGAGFLRPSITILGDSARIRPRVEPKSGD